MQDKDIILFLLFGDLIVSVFFNEKSIFFHLPECHVYLKPSFHIKDLEVCFQDPYSGPKHITNHHSFKVSLHLQLFVSHLVLFSSVLPIINILLFYVDFRINFLHVKAKTVKYLENETIGE